MEIACDFCQGGPAEYHIVCGSLDCEVINHLRVCHRCKMYWEEAFSKPWEEAFSKIMDGCPERHYIHDMISQKI